MINALVFTGAFSQHAIQRIEDVLTTEFPSNQPGAVVLIARHDSVLYRRAFGMADFESGMPLREDMAFQIASMTKQFTGAAIMQLAEGKYLSLTDPVEKYIDYFPDKGYTITIENLLSQTSGIPEFFDLDESEYHLLTREHTPRELINYFKDRKLDFQPGTSFGYSNSNYVLLGAIIEKVGGQSYEDHLQEFILNPMKLNNTSVWYMSSVASYAYPRGYSLKDGRYQPSPELVGSVVYSSGGIVSTVDDLFSWTKQFVKERKVMFTKPGYHYGLNVKQLQGSPTIQHGGNLFGFTSSGIYLPNEDVYVCILSNAAFRGTEEIADYIASEMIGKPLKYEPKARNSGSELDEYTGVYSLQNTMRTMKIIVVSNMLVLTFPDQPGSAVDVKSIDKDVFESKKIKAQLTFIRGANKKITSVEVKQGKTYTWIREQ